jgi:hypothetical protein
MRRLRLVTGNLKELNKKTIFTLAAVVDNKVIHEWKFDSEKERSDFLLSRNARSGDIEFSDDDLKALGINPKTLK